MKTAAGLTAALFLLVSGISAAGSNQTPLNVLVINSVTSTPDKLYNTTVAYRGILLGALRRLQESNTGFNFAYTEDPNYGPFLQSVNGLAGCLEEQTYWKLQVKLPNNTIITPDVGIGCYIPSANEQIILNYSKF